MSKNFNQLLNEIQQIEKKLNDPKVEMEDSIHLFKQGVELIKEAKEKLSVLEAEVKTVLDNNETLDFE